MKKILIVLILLAAAGAAVFFAGKNQSNTAGNTPDSVGVANDPINKMLDYYQAYLAAEQNAATSPAQEGLLEDPILSFAVRSYIADSPEGSVDPVLCQSVTPQKTRSRTLYEEENKAQVQVLGRLEGEKLSEQAVVTLERKNDAWRITEIQCLQGESAPEREFTFDREGYLLKSVPEPLDANYWHLVFEQNGTKGHTVPLFTDEAECTLLDGTIETCDMSKVDEATRAKVKGQMTESGVSVQFIELVSE